VKGITLTISIFMLSLGLLACQSTTEEIQKSNLDKQPNIILIVADDMGFTDLGAFGSEINTPNLDKLAYEGMRLTNFHASPQCAPTRSILMSGTNNHTAGMGSMFNDIFIRGEFGDRKGYEGYLHPRVASLPERLREAGYHTYMTGKWHLGGDDEKKPTARGFDQAFALMQGNAHHMQLRGMNKRPPHFRENGKPIQKLPDNYFSANTFTDKLIEYIDANQTDEQPFFGYLALTSPHWPLQAPTEYLDKYAGVYDKGYDVLKTRRRVSAESLGVVPKVKNSEFDQVGESWRELTPEQQRYSARTMEVYAAMIDNMDDNIGRLTAYLEKTGELDNTLIFFMSDNGAEPDLEYNPTFGNDLLDSGYYDNSYNNIGETDSWIFYGPGWAQAATAPFRMYKGSMAEGGTRVSAIAWNPNLISGGQIEKQYLSVMDLMPTFLDLAKADFDPTQFNGKPVVPIEGRSFSSVLAGENALVYNPEDVIAKELHGQRSLKRGDFKILWEQRTVQMYWADEVPNHWRQWRLYNLKEDPTELTDLSASMPELKQELVTLWNEWAEANNVRTEIEAYWRKPLRDGIETLGRPKGKVYPVPN